MHKHTKLLHLSLMTLWLVVVYTLTLPELKRMSLTPPEGWTAYAVRNPAPTSYEPPRGIRAQIREPLRAAQADALATWGAAHAPLRAPLYLLSLDVWTWLTSEHPLMLRLPSLWAGLLALALVYRLGRRMFGEAGMWLAAILWGGSAFVMGWMQRATPHLPLMLLALALTFALVRAAQRQTLARVGLALGLAALCVAMWETTTASSAGALAFGLGVLVCAGLLARVRAYRVQQALWVGLLAAQLLLVQVFLPTPPPYTDTLHTLQAERAPLEPLFYAFAPQHPVHVYRAHIAFTAGLAVDLGWRDFSQAELSAHAARVAQAPSVWVLLPQDAPTFAALTDALSAQGRTLNTRASVGDLRLLRFDLQPE